MSRARTSLAGRIHRAAGCAVLVWLAAWSALMSAGLPGDLATHLPILARNLAAGLFLTAGVLRMATWRLGGDPAQARGGIALLAMGTALPAAVLLRLLVHDGPFVDLETPATRLLYVVPVLVVVLIGARRSRAALRLSIAVLALTTLAVPAVLTAATSVELLGHDHLLAWLAVESVTAAAWLTLAVQRWLSPVAGDPTPGWTVAALLLFAASEGLAAWSIAVPGAVHGLTSGLQLAAAAIALALAGVAVRDAVRVETGAAGELTRALVESEARLAAVEQEQRERLHDARSAVLGVLSASQLLAAPRGLPALDPVALQAMVSDELHRLHGLLDTDHAETVRDFELADALRAVLLAHRADGAMLDVDLAGVWVRGCPAATATVLDNLLTNAGRHAPRARVAITARRVGEVVEVSVVDDGPGIAAEERELVLRAGGRGSSALGPGTGLGLPSAARAMARQQGSLHLGAGTDGGTRVLLRLRAAMTARPDHARPDHARPDHARPDHARPDHAMAG